MKYLILIYTGPENADLPGRADQAADPGELVAGGALAHPVNTVTVRVGGELGEQLSGYLVVDCDSGHRAAEIAAQVPGSTVEIHPIMALSGQEM
ncbi:YciI family protein [Nonomuraea sp. NPDC050790]|uniref:YciI family protein n=1 Tax=Nonomuraea sp. NPDC050790 TaxID=3364371 RepID=UPI00378E4A62